MANEIGECFNKKPFKQQDPFPLATLLHSETPIGRTANGKISLVLVNY